MIETLRLMTGVDIPVPELEIAIHQPNLREIAMLGETDFFTAAQYICLDKNRLAADQTELKDVSNFQILMKLLEQPEAAQKKPAINNLLTVLFPSHQPILTPGSIILNNFETKETTLIDTNNFDMIKEMLAEVLCIKKSADEEQTTYNPKNAAAAKIAAKIMEGRRKVAEAKSKMGKKEDSIISRYISILAVALHWTMEDCLNLTLFQLFDIMERYSLYTNYDLDLRVRLAGGESKQEMENWMKSLHDK